MREMEEALLKGYLISLSIIMFSGMLILMEIAMMELPSDVKALSIAAVAMIIIAAGAMVATLLRTHLS